MGRTSDYGHGLYKQLEEVMTRLDHVEKTSAMEIEHLNDRIDILEKENADLKKENQLLSNDNARLKSILNNDSSNISYSRRVPQRCVRNFSIKETVIYRAMKSKSINALGKLRFLENYAGILSHDHEEALYHFGTDHAECNVHIIRYLRKNTEETGHMWSEEMITLLSGMNKARKALINEGARHFQEEAVCTYEESYQKLLEQGRKENKKRNTNMQRKMNGH